MTKILPDCMAPDGADPCRAYQNAMNEIGRLRSALQEIAELEFEAGYGDDEAATIARAALQQRSDG